MPTHNPMKDEEIERYMEEERAKFIWPNAEYPAIIVETLETLSKAGDPMWVIKSKLTNLDLTTTIKSWYVFKTKPNIENYKLGSGDVDQDLYNKDLKAYMFCTKKIRDLFEAVDKLDYYENNKVNGENVINADELQGCQYTVLTKVTKDDNGERMVINNFKKLDIIDDDLPF